MHVQTAIDLACVLSILIDIDTGGKLLTLIISIYIRHCIFCIGEIYMNNEIIYERHTITWSHQKSKTRIEIDVRGC